MFVTKVILPAIQNNVGMYMQITILISHEVTSGSVSLLKFTHISVHISLFLLSVPRSFVILLLHTEVDQETDYPYLDGSFQYDIKLRRKEDSNRIPPGCNKGPA